MTIVLFQAFKNGVVLLDFMVLFVYDNAVDDGMCLLSPGLCFMVLELVNIVGF